MNRFKVMGARLMVDPIVTTLSMEERAKRANLELVLENESRPRPTQGRVIGMGNDPLLAESVHIGDIVHFSWHSGSQVFIEDHEYRMLDFQEITLVEESVDTVSADSTPQT